MHRFKKGKSKGCPYVTNYPEEAPELQPWQGLGLDCFGKAFVLVLRLEDHMADAPLHEDAAIAISLLGICTVPYYIEKVAHRAICGYSLHPTMSVFRETDVKHLNNPEHWLSEANFPHIPRNKRVKKKYECSPDELRCYGGLAKGPHSFLNGRQFLYRPRFNPRYFDDREWKETIGGLA